MKIRNASPYVRRCAIFSEAPSLVRKQVLSLGTPADYKKFIWFSACLQPSVPQMPIASLSPVTDGGGNKISASLVSSDPGPQPVTSGENNTDLIK